MKYVDYKANDISDLPSGHWDLTEVESHEVDKVSAGLLQGGEEELSKALTIMCWKMWSTKRGYR